MRTFDFETRWQALLTPAIVSLLTQLREYKGRQGLFAEQQAETLSGLLAVAKIQSTDASNKIEGISTSDERLKLLAMDKTKPKTRDESEIAGYRDVLNTIHDNHDYIPIRSSFILQLHKDLYKYSGFDRGGSYKSADNIISEQLSDGTQRARFIPLPAWETPEAVDALCKAYHDCLHRSQCDELLLIPMFILDFLCIHPFNDGNGRMSRLLTLLLLYRAKYTVGKYISIERIIERSKQTYYETLQASSYEWHEGKNDDAPFVQYFLGVLLAACREFDERIAVLCNKNDSKPKRVAKFIQSTWGEVSKQDILLHCSDISQTTVQRSLRELLASGRIIKIGDKRYTKYRWNHEAEPPVKSD
ncbi:MAG: Fic family protein [Rikenellaceae bacterium]